MAPIVLSADEELKKARPPPPPNLSDGIFLRMRCSVRSSTWTQERTCPCLLHAGRKATANDIESLPPNSSGKGRFYEIFFVDLPVEDAPRPDLPHPPRQTETRPPKNSTSPPRQSSPPATPASKSNKPSSPPSSTPSPTKPDSTHRHPPQRPQKPFALLSVTMAEKIDDLRTRPKTAASPVRISLQLFNRLI